MVVVVAMMVVVTVGWLGLVAWLVRLGLSWLGGVFVGKLARYTLAEVTIGLSCCYFLLFFHN